MVSRELVTSSVSSDYDHSKVYGPDEHVAAVWINEKDNVLSWFLGVVESASKSDIYVHYYNRRDKNGLSWNFPDDSMAVKTPINQVISGGITVSYMQTSAIRCKLDKDTVFSIEKAFDQYLKKIDLE